MTAGESSRFLHTHTKGPGTHSINTCPSEADKTNTKALQDLRSVFSTPHEVAKKELLSVLLEHNFLILPTDLDVEIQLLFIHAEDG